MLLPAHVPPVQYLRRALASLRAMQPQAPKPDIYK